MLPFKYRYCKVIRIKFTKKHNIEINVTFRKTGILKLLFAGEEHLQRREKFLPW